MALFSACHQINKTAPDLLNGVGIGETPASVHVCLSDVFAGVAAAAFGLQTTVARSTIVGIMSRVDLVKVVLQFYANSARHSDPLLIQPSLQNIVCEVALRLAADIHDI